MSITVRELLQLPHLRLTLTAGEAGLDREVSWVHSSDLPDPWEWLGPSELLLTNGTTFSPEEPAQVRFIERLAETGVSGLGIGMGMSGPPLSARASRRADELALPLLAVPYSMPFTAVVRAVADANDREEARLLARVARLYELLRTSVIAGRPGPEMFRRLGEELGVRLYLVDPETGLSLFGDEESTSFGGELMASYAAHGKAIPGVLRLGKAQAESGEPGALAVEVPGDQPTALVAEPVGNQLPSLVLLHHIATGGALELAQLAAVQERQWRQGADLLSQLLDRRIDLFEKSHGHVARQIDRAWRAVDHDGQGREMRPAREFRHHAPEHPMHVLRQDDEARELGRAAVAHEDRGGRLVARGLDPQHDVSHGRSCA